MTIPPKVTQQPTAAVFVVRAWRDNGQFRARVTSSVSVDVTAESPEQIQILTSDPDDVRGYLAAWLSEI